MHVLLQFCTFNVISAAFANYSHLATYDELYGYIIAAIVFMANIKFLKILSFNKHIVQLVATLKHVRLDL